MSSARSADDASSDATITFPGGLWERGRFLHSMTSWPFVPLRVDTSGVTIRPRTKILRVLLFLSGPTLVFPWEAIARAELVWHTFSMPPRGVQLIVTNTSTRVVFWMWRPERLLEVLERRGVEVDRQVSNVSVWRWLWGKQ